MAQGKDAMRVLLDSSKTRLDTSVGVEASGGTFTPILERGLSIPCQKIEVFSTAADNQESIDIHVLQGNVNTISDPSVISIGKFSLKGIPHARAAVPQIQVCFSVNFIGKFQLSAKDLITGCNIEVSALPDTEHPYMPQEEILPDAKCNEEKKAIAGDAETKGGLVIKISIVRLDHAFYQIGDTTPGPIWMPRDRGSYVPVKVTVLNKNISVHVPQEKIDYVLKERALGIKAGILVVIGIIAVVMSFICLGRIVDAGDYLWAVITGIIAVTLWTAVVKIAKQDVKYTSITNPSPKQLKLIKEAALQEAATARHVSSGWPELSRNEEGEYNTPKSCLFESSWLASELEGWVADEDGRTYRRKGYRDGDYS